MTSDFMAGTPAERLRKEVGLSVNKDSFFAADILAVCDELAKYQWISVKDELPEADGEYLCAWSDGSIETFSFDVDYPSFQPVLTVRKNYWVTHWMPLPAHPNEAS